MFTLKQSCDVQFKEFQQQTKSNPDQLRTMQGNELSNIYSLETLWPQAWIKFTEPGINW